ncbi:MAG TPA: helix-turn-helix domain-containing protein [Acidothermaceae bacterium]|jgi:transcriptional regulator with XRE-family HTH domain
MANSFDLGAFIREQRRNAQISVRQLSRLAGVSNPYLSQIERGLRRPSAEILQQIAKGLRISAEALYVQAGILDERIAGGVVVDAVLADTTLTERQKQVMLEVYDSFRKENQRRQTDEALAAEMARRAAPSNDAFAEAVDTIDDLDDIDDAGEARGAGADDADPVEPVVLPPLAGPPMRTTMTRHNPRRLP